MRTHTPHRRGAGGWIRTAAWILALVLPLLAACGPGAVPEPDPEPDGASGDNPRNQDGIGEQELLVVSFGTSYNDARQRDIGGIEAALEAAFPDWSVRRAFTSQTIIDHVRDRDGEEMDNVGAALNRAAANGVRRLLVQPTHLMNGYEYEDLVEELAEYADAFEEVALGAPLLDSAADFDAVAAALIEAAAEYNEPGTAVIFMGHGTGASANAAYAAMQEEFAEQAAGNFYVATVESTPTIQDVAAALEDRADPVRRTVLLPLMVVAGDHASNDMAGDDPESWKSILEAAGYDVVCVLEGIGAVPQIQALYAAHARAALDAPMDAAALRAAAAALKLADAAAVQGTTEIPAGGAVWADLGLPDGTYRIAVTLSGGSGRASIAPPVNLSVLDGVPVAWLNWSSQYYDYMIVDGTRYDDQNPEGLSLFAIPVAAFDVPLPVLADTTAMGTPHEIAYTLTFDAASIEPLEP